MTRRLAPLTAVLAALTFAACGDDSSGGDSASGGGKKLTLSIGYSGALTGLYAAYDEPVLNGMKYAAEKVNAAGDVKVEIVSADNAGTAQQTVQTTQKMLDDEVLLHVIGVGDGRNAGGRLVVGKGGIALATLNTYPTFVDDIGDRAAMITVPDNVQAAASAEQACKDGHKTAYILYSNDFTYSKNLPRYFAETFEKECGGKIVGEDAFKLGQTDFGPQVTKLKNASPAPDAIYTPMFVPDSNTFVKQLRQAGVKAPYLSSDANYIPEFIKAAGAASEGATIPGYALNEEGQPLGDFHADYTKVMGKEPATTVYEAVGHDQVMALVAAAEAAGAAEPDAILEELKKGLSDDLVALRESKLDPATRVPTTAELAMVRVEDGKFVSLGQIVPKSVPAARR
jgi:branched-chain amino acid transport system substrate-binding protein